MLVGLFISTNPPLVDFVEGQHAVLGMKLNMTVQRPHACVRRYNHDVDYIIGFQQDRVSVVTFTDRASVTGHDLKELAMQVHWMEYTGVIHKPQLFSLVLGSGVYCRFGPGLAVDCPPEPALCVAGQSCGLGEFFTDDR